MACPRSSEQRLCNTTGVCQPCALLTAPAAATSGPPRRFAPLRAFFPTAAPSRDTTLYAMLARVRSAAVLGIDAYLVEVETDIANGLPTFATVGLPQGAVKEGRERVFAAIANSGYTFPLKRITG